MYRAITTVFVNNDKCTNFWLDDWLACGPIPDHFTSLASHVRNLSKSVKQVLRDELVYQLKTHLSTVANQELASLQQLVSPISLFDQADERRSPLIRTDGKMKTRAIYNLLRASTISPLPTTPSYGGRSPPMVKNL